ncbi:hypothetical protein GCM10023093_02830 [Nemorincola caseinilytica]|uniref:DUF4394 domain-containing protein n=2 Tax=Nemorincola caseinilytica TaxID=2054315 RepID=A0ABP8N2U6_9BACT
MSGPYTVSGVATGQALVALDTRSSNGQLYALGYDSLTTISQLYRITYNASTGAYSAVTIGSGMTAIDLGVTNNASMDFISSTGNQIRIIGRNGNNYILNADNGTLMSTGISGLSFASGDAHVGTMVMGATAYTNNFFGADATQQVGFDVLNNVLVKMEPGNFGNGFNNASNFTHSIGLTSGVVFASGSSMGMDTWYDTLTGVNTIYLSGTALLSGGAHLYKYTMSSGTGTLIDLGAMGSGTLHVRDIAFASDRDTTTAITGNMITGLTLNMRNLVWFDSDRPQNIRKMVRLTGMAAGQAMVAIDYSANGWLYGLGYNSTAHNYQLYKIDTLSGAVTAVNSTPVSLNLGTDDGSGNYVRVGFRFIATATTHDRIRLTSSNGSVNVQLDANSGAIVATNSPLQYVTGDTYFGTTANVTSIAYTGYSGDTVTQMFGFDASTGSMVMFNNTNSTAGYGDGSSGYINTIMNLNAILSLLLHTSAYNNAYMNISYDQASASNYGYMVANYYGDSSMVNNYSVMYDMSSMLTAYHRGTAGAPAMVGRVGYGTPVKDIALRRWALPPSTIVPYAAGGNKLLVYPNPVLSDTRIMLNEQPTGIVQASVLGMTGRIEATYKYAPGTRVLYLDMSTLPVGLYNVQVSGAGIATTNLRVVKQ